jgi:hypothetical protein
MNLNSDISNSPGLPGQVYKSATGNEFYEFERDKGEGVMGWEQIDAMRRLWVRRVREGRYCIWMSVKEPDPPDSKEYPLS